MIELLLGNGFVNASPALPVTLQIKISPCDISPSVQPSDSYLAGFTFRHD
jgi:hypothetical protein